MSFFERTKSYFSRVVRNDATKHGVALPVPVSF